MFDLVSELSADKVFFIEGTSLANTLAFCLQKLHLLNDVAEVLVILSIVVDVGKKAPLIEVIDSILEDGILGVVAPEALVEPRRKGFDWFVRGIIRRGV